jgi:hypothetical protein
MTFLAKWWLSRQGYYLVGPGSCQMVLSGQFAAQQNADGSYHVAPPFPKAFVVALNHSIVLLNKAVMEGKP